MIASACIACLLLVPLGLLPGATVDTLPPLPSPRFDLPTLVAETEVTPAMRTAGAVVLRKHCVIRVEPGVGEQLQLHVAVLVLDRAAAEAYADVVIAFDSFHMGASLDFARVLTPDGRLREVNRNAVQFQSPYSPRMYTGHSLLVFSVPALTPGAVVEYQVTLHRIRDLIPGQWQHEIHFQYFQFNQTRGTLRIDPIRSSLIEVQVPSDSTPRIVLENCQVTPEVAEHDGWTHTTWELDGLPGRPMEVLSDQPLNHLPSVNVGSPTSWDAIESWLQGVFLPACESTESIAARARQAAGGLTGLREKIEAVYYLVQDEVRYVSADGNLDSMTPDQAEVVLNNGYGDCKDQAVLLVALLGALDIKAYPALVNLMSDEVLNPEVPGVADFGHCVCYVPTAAGDFWLDTSPDSGVFPGITWDARGRWALVIGDVEEHLVRTPAAAPDENQITIEVHYRFEGDLSHGRLAFTAQGSFGREFKQVVQMAQDRAGLMSAIVQELYPSADVTAVEYPGIDDSRSPFCSITEFSTEFEGLAANYFFTYSGDLSSWIALVPALTLPIAERPRATNLVVGAPCRLVLVHHCPPPNWTFQPDIIGTELHMTAPGLDFRREIRPNLSCVEVRLELEVQQSVIPAEQVAAFQAGVQDILEQSVWNILYYR